MMVGWVTKNIGDIAQVKGGKRVPKGYKLETTPTAHPYITVTNFSDDGSIDRAKLSYINNKVYEQISRYTISHKDLYISIAGTIGKTGSIPEELDGANLTENACKLILNPDIDKDFVYYCTRSTDFIEQAVVNTRVAAQPKLALERLKTITLRVPPLPEQKRIVAILDEAFAGIDAAVANTEKNLANARELFESYLNGVFTRKGDGWVEKTLGNIADFKNGLNFTKSSKGEKIKIVGVKNFKSNYWVPKENLDTVQIEGTLSVAYALQKRDILTVRSNGNKQLIGRCILTDELHEKTSHSGFTIRIRVHAPDVEPEYLVHYLKSSQVHELLINSGEGANISSLNQQALSSLPVLLPTIKEQAQIVSRIEAIAIESSRLESIYQQKFTALAELKQSILQKAFAGELTTMPEETFKEAVA